MAGRERIDAAVERADVDAPGVDGGRGVEVAVASAAPGQASGAGCEREHLAGVVADVDPSVGERRSSPGGLGVATTKGKVAELWDASTGRHLHTLAGRSGHSSLVTDAEFSPSGVEPSRSATTTRDASGASVAVICAASLSGTLSRFTSAATAPTATGSSPPASSRPACGTRARGQLVSYLVGHTATLTGASFSLAGNWILTGSMDGTARVYQCVICQPLKGLEATARARIRALG